jgi:hypothetical protein
VFFVFLVFVFLVFVFLVFVSRPATSCGGTLSQSHPRTSRGRREQQLNFACADVGPQGPAECATTTCFGDALGLGQLGLSEPTEPSTPAVAFSVDRELASGA